MPVPGRVETKDLVSAFLKPSHAPVICSLETLSCGIEVLGPCVTPPLHLWGGVWSSALPRSHAGGTVGKLQSKHSVLLSPLRSHDKNEIAHWKEELRFYGSF